MNDGRELESASPHGSARAAREGRLVYDAAGCVDVDLLARQPEEQLEARVAKGLREHLTGRLWRCTAGSELFEETLDVTQTLVAGAVEAPVHHELNS